jgi:hypothetical protein
MILACLIEMITDEFLLLLVAVEQTGQHEMDDDDFQAVEGLPPGVVVRKPKSKSNKNGGMKNRSSNVLIQKNHGRKSDNERSDDEEDDDDEELVVDEDDDESGGTASIVEQLRGSSKLLQQKGAGIVTPANLGQVLHQQDSEATHHSRMVGLSRDKRKALVKAFVKDKLFHTIKFISNEKELDYEYPHFAVPIMKHMGVAPDERERWWEENKRDAKKAMAERRASITGAMKQTAKGTLDGSCFVLNAKTNKAFMIVAADNNYRDDAW